MQGEFVQPTADEIRNQLWYKMEKILPTILMLLDFGAAVPYLFKGNLRMTVYWLAAGTLTLSLTWLKE